jgi:hypothetical protein
VSKIAVTITACALVPADEYDERIAEIHSSLEHGLQDAEVDYVIAGVQRGIPAEVSDLL